LRRAGAGAPAGDALPPRARDDAVLTGHARRLARPRRSGLRSPRPNGAATALSPQRLVSSGRLPVPGTALHGLDTYYSAMLTRPGRDPGGQRRTDRAASRE